MDDGIGALVLLTSVLLISLFVYTLLADEALFVVIVILSIVLLALIVYTSAIVIVTKLDKKRATKEWKEFEDMEKIQPSFKQEP